MRVLSLTVALLLAAAPAFAETVEVKYGGSVDLADYECAETVSSFVHRICFDEENAHVVVRLRDTYYEYCRLDAETVAEWLAADSKGRYYNQNIRSDATSGRFDCK